MNDTEDDEGDKGNITPDRPAAWIQAVFRRATAAKGPAGIIVMISAVVLGCITARTPAEVIYALVALVGVFTLLVLVAGWIAWKKPRS